MEKGLGYVKDTPDQRDYLWRSVVLRETLDLPDYFKTNPPPVLDQGSEPECVTHALKSMKQYQEVKQSRRYYNFDEGYHYQLCKQNDGIPTIPGTYIRVACDLTLKQGYLARREQRKLKADTAFKIGSYVRLTTIQEIKECIFLYGGVVFGINVDIGIANRNLVWKGRRPFFAPPNNLIIGGHAMYLYGWYERFQAFYVQNSWGTSWGNRGRALIGYEHFEAYPDWDAWKILDEDLAPQTL